MIDVHAHVLPRRYLSFLDEKRIAVPTVPLPLAGTTAWPAYTPWTDSTEDLAERYRLMDKAGVAEQVLSVTFPPYFDDEKIAAEAASLINEELAGIAARSGGRLRAFASLPLPHINASLREIDNAFGLGLAGITVQCFCQERSLADPYFEPLYAEMNRRRAILFLHPSANGLCSRFLRDWKLSASLGPPLEDVVVAVHYIVSGIPRRYSDIEIIIPHLAGALPMLLARIGNQVSASIALAEPPHTTARRMWYDTCCHGSAEAMHAAVGVFGAERILPGSDYPFLSLHEPYGDTLGFLTRIGLSEDDLDKILRRNAATLFARSEARGEGV